MGSLALLQLRRSQIFQYHLAHAVPSVMLLLAPTLVVDFLFRAELLELHNEMIENDLFKGRNMNQFLGVSMLSLHFDILIYISAIPTPWT